MTQIDVRQYKEAAAKVRKAEASLTKKFKAELANVAKPLGEDVVREGSEPLPSRGGLRELIRSRSRISVSPTSQGVALIVRNPKVKQLGSIDSKGVVRHPVFGRLAGSARGMLAGARAAGLSGRSASRAARMQRRGGWAWVAQSVHGRTFSKALDERKDDAARRVMAVAEATLRQVSG